MHDVVLTLCACWGKTKIENTCYLPIHAEGHRKHSSRVFRCSRMTFALSRNLTDETKKGSEIDVSIFMFFCWELSFNKSLKSKNLKNFSTFGKKYDCFLYIETTRRNIFTIFLDLGFLDLKNQPPLHITLCIDIIIEPRICLGTLLRVRFHKKVNFSDRYVRKGLGK